MGVSQKSADGSKLDGESLGKVMKVKVCSINPSENISFKTPAGLNQPPPQKKRTSHCFSSRTKHVHRWNESLKYSNARQNVSLFINFFLSLL